VTFEVNNAEARDFCVYDNHEIIEYKINGIAGHIEQGEAITCVLQ
jgi:hypothetical protein